MTFYFEDDSLLALGFQSFCMCLKVSSRGFRLTVLSKHPSYAILFADFRFLFEAYFSPNLDYTLLCSLLFFASLITFWLILPLELFNLCTEALETVLLSMLYISEAVKLKSILDFMSFIIHTGEICYTLTRNF